MERPQNTELIVDPHVAQWFVRTVTRTVASYAVIVGIAILLGGPQRFAGLSYRVAIETPGAPESWGIAILTAGIFMMGGSVFANPRLIGFGALIGAAWALLFAWAFGTAAWQFEEANTTAVWAYLTLFILCALITGVHFAMHPIKAPWRRERKA